jgi:hypothetical protein
MDVPASVQLAGQEGLHLSASRRVPKRRHPSHMRRDTGSEEGFELHCMGHHQGKAGPDLRVCDDGGGGLKIAYDADVLPQNHLLSRMMLEEAHRVDHGGVESIMMCSCAHAWVTRAKNLANRVKRNCFVCKRRAKERETQKMAPCQNIGWAQPLSLSQPQWIYLDLSSSRIPSISGGVIRPGG